jgi:hypothetical protein
MVRRFDPPPRPWLPGHRGVDLAADPGAPVYAAGPGVVRFAGEVAGRGVVSVDHAGGLRTTYEPVTPAVTEGRAAPACTGDSGAARCTSIRWRCWASRGCGCCR